MVTQKTRFYIRVIGVILILVDAVVFFYGVVGGVTYYPYKEFTLPLSGLGIIIIVISFVSRVSKTNSTIRFCPRCRRKIEGRNVEFCPHCGYDLR